MKNTSLKWLYTVSGSKKFYILALTIVEAILGGCGVVFALLLRGVVDSAASHDGAGFRRNLLMIFLLVVVQTALAAVFRRLTEYTRSTVENLFKGRLTEMILRRDYQRVNAVHSGEWLNRLTNDTAVVADNFVGILPGFAGMVVRLVGAVVMIMALEPLFVVIVIPGGALIVLLTWLFRRVLKRLHKQVQEEDGRLRIFLQERIGSLLMIRSFAAEKRTLEETGEKMGRTWTPG